LAIAADLCDLPRFFVPLIPGKMAPTSAWSPRERAGSPKSKWLPCGVRPATSAWRRPPRSARSERPAQEVAGWHPTRLNSGARARLPNDSVFAALRQRRQLWLIQ